MSWISEQLSHVSFWCPSRNCREPRLGHQTDLVCPGGCGRLCGSPDLKSGGHWDPPLEWLWGYFEVYCRAVHLAEDLTMGNVATASPCLALTAMKHHWHICPFLSVGHHLAGWSAMQGWTRSGADRGWSWTHWGSVVGTCLPWIISIRHKAHLWNMEKKSKKKWFVLNLLSSVATSYKP